MGNVLFLLGFLSVFFTSCSENSEIYINENNLILGSWSYPEYSGNGNTIIYTRVQKVLENEYTCTFVNDGSFWERKNSIGWCGTPPITYKDFSGTWKQTAKETLLINSTYWGGTSIVEWEIQSINDQQLIISITNLSN